MIRLFSLLCEAKVIYTESIVRTIVEVRAAAMDQAPIITRHSESDLLRSKRILTSGPKEATSPEDNMLLRENLVELSSFFCSDVVAMYSSNYIISLSVILVRGAKIFLHKIIN
jgi:hypothetical protein